jgi:hypothetical protein
MDDAKTCYGKKVDKLVLYILIPSFLISVWPMFISSEAFWILLIVNLLTWGFIYWAFKSTNTCIVGDLLIHNTGPISWEIEIENIVAVRPKSKSMINHGTWSMDKMDIIYQEKYKKTLSIAPLLKEELIHKLMVLNPKIKLS